jgi:hypothetical protein
VRNRLSVGVDHDAGERSHRDVRESASGDGEHGEQWQNEKASFHQGLPMIPEEIVTFEDGFAGAASGGCCRKATVLKYRSGEARPQGKAGSGWAAQTILRPERTGFESNANYF